MPDTFASFLLRERGVAKEELQQDSDVGPDFRAMLGAIFGMGGEGGGGEGGVGCHFSCGKGCGKARAVGFC